MKTIQLENNKEITAFQQGLKKWAEENGYYIYIPDEPVIVLSKEYNLHFYMIAEVNKLKKTPIFNTEQEGILITSSELETLRDNPVVTEAAVWDNEGFTVDKNDDVYLDYETIQDYFDLDLEKFKNYITKSWSN